jgi:ABC-type Na+ efflux pump permease subunit
MEKAAPDMSVLQNAMGVTLFCASFISIGIYSSVFSYQSLVREKARGNIQALLATPVSPREMWMGKSLAVFIPGLIFTVVMDYCGISRFEYNLLYQVIPDLFSLPGCLLSNL